MGKIILFLVLLFPALLKAQYTAAYLFRATATISPAAGLAYNPNNIYLNGELEAFFDAKHSVRGDIFALVGTLEDKQVLQMHHHLMVGPQWHKGVGILDVYGGFSAGLTLTQYANSMATMFYPQRLSACFSPNLGVSAYFSDYFHFFANARWLSNVYTGGPGRPRNMDELVFSAGLGLHFKARKG